MSLGGSFKTDKDFFGASTAPRVRISSETRKQKSLAITYLRYRPEPCEFREGQDINPNNNKLKSRPRAGSVLPGRAHEIQATDVTEQ